jgi:hypothetical protein
MNKIRVALISALLAPAGAMAAGDDVKLNVGGFIWADAGFGDRYDNSDDDRLGVFKTAVTLSPEYKNTRGVLVLGSDNLFGQDQFSTGNDSGDNGDIKAQEAFVGIKWNALGGELDVTAGKQPILFGLKPNGWVGDRSITFGPEFGGAGGLNVSGQVQTAIIADWSFGADSGGSMVSSVGPEGVWVFRFGAFDTDDGDVAGGTSITDNWFGQVRAENLLGTGIYGSAGYEQVDVAGSSESIISVGAGWRWDKLDLSLEYQAIDMALAGTLDDETQFIAEATYNINQNWSAYVDYAVQDEADTDSIRVGTTWMYNEHVDFTAEYSDDSYDIGALDGSSIDFRMAFSF